MERRRNVQPGGIVWQGSYEFIVNQWGVGHGGFHSQSIFFQPLNRNPTANAGNGSQLRVIYDCGSGRKTIPTSALKFAVGRMLSDVADGSKIDLLAISHFDQDHINGLNHIAAELTRRRIRVARVWAPALTKIEVLFAITSSGLTGAERDTYAAFVDDPVGRLTELFAGAEVTRLMPDEAPIPLPPTATGTTDANTGDGSDIVLTTSPGGRALVARQGAFAGEALWELQPYVVKSTLAGATTVSAAVRKLLRKPIEQCSLDDLIKIANHPTLSAAFHAAVRQHHMQLKRSTRTSSARTGSNLSSLCLYSGPVSPYDWCHFRRGWAPIDDTPHAIPIAPAWLGTGDAGLQGVHHVDSMRTALTQGRLDRVGITSAPHHGSRHDSDAPLWDALPNARWVTVEANHSMGGAGNHHPHTQVLAELATRNLIVHTSINGRDFSWRDKRIR